MLDSARHASHWWHTLIALPATQEGVGYERLKRVWFDHTRFLEAKESVPGVRRQNRSHEFAKITHETHLTASLWENFTLFDASSWLPALFSKAGLRSVEVSRCGWSYEWEQDWKDDNGKRQDRMCDIVVEFETRDTARHVLVVEAKALGKPLGEKELKGGYYLDIPEIAAFGTNRHLLFLIDASMFEATRMQLSQAAPKTAVVTWQQLGGLQVELAKKTLVADERIRNFVTAAIQYQFLQHGIIPTRLSADYLLREPNMEEIDLLPKGDKQSMAVHTKPLWRL